MEHENNRKALNRAMTSVADFRDVIDYLEAIAPETSDRLRIAAVLASVISYCRLFTENKTGSLNESHSKINLKLSSVLKKSEMKMHDRVFSMRKSAIAHSDFDKRPSYIYPTNKTRLSFFASSDSHYVLEINKEELLNISRKLHDAIYSEILTLKNKLGI